MITMTHAVSWFSAAEVSSESPSTWSEGLTRANDPSTTALVNIDKMPKNMKQVTPLKQTIGKVDKKVLET